MKKHIGRNHTWVGVFSFGAGLLLTAGLALGASRKPGGELPKPSYAIPNAVAIVMCLSVLAIPYKRFRRV